MRAAGEFLWALLVLTAIAAMLGLAGCSSPPRVPDVVSVAVPVACLRPGGAPAVPAIAGDAELAGLDDYDLVRRVAAERAALIAWLTEVVPLLEVCSRAPGVDAIGRRSP